MGKVIDLKRGTLIVSCDPSTQKSAFAIFSKSGLERYAKVETRFGEIRTFFNQFENNEFAFFIEDQYLNLNVKTLMRLVSARTMILTLARVAGAVKCEAIPPQRWQTIMLGVGIKAKRDQRKRVSCLMASEIAGRKIDDPDVADAICIGDYVRRMANLKNHDKHD